MPGGLEEVVVRLIRAGSWSALVVLTLASVPAHAKDEKVNLSVFTPVSLAKAEDAVTAFRLNLIYGRNTSVKFVDLGLFNHTTAGASLPTQSGTDSVTKGGMSGLLQLGAMNVNQRANCGIQAGAFNLTQSEIQAFLEVGAANISKRNALCIVQAGAVNGTSGEMETVLQLGAINIDGRLEGIQLGAINVIGQTGNGNGLQIALINYADNTKVGSYQPGVFQLGAINIIRHRGFLPVSIIANWTKE